MKTKVKNWHVDILKAVIIIAFIVGVILIYLYGNTNGVLC